MKQKLKDIYEKIKNHFPEAHCELFFSNVFELLIATILSAQCTDVQVNKVTKKLFLKFKTPEDFKDANIKDVEKLIYSTGFYKNKAKNIIECSKDIVLKFNGKVPDNMEDLTSLRGVGRKTANVVLFNGFHKNEGIVVDTHVKRISNRLGFTKNQDPIKIEEDLKKIFNKNEWGMVSHYFIFLGRRLCMSRNPNCEECFLKEDCYYYAKN
jgi:endonuclease-3